MQKKYIVYEHKNLINNKSYIGITFQTPQDRWRNNGKGYQGQKKFYNAIQKYGWENFEHIILYTDLTQEEAAEKERQLIKEKDSINNGYNVQPGGQITEHSLLTREHISKSLTGKKRDPKAIEQMKNTKIQKYGKKVRCIEKNITYNSIGEAARAENIDKNSIGKVCAHKQITAGGYHWEYVDLSTSNKPLKDQRKKAVICLTTNTIYNSVTEAAKDTNSDPSNITKVCNGKYKTTNNLKWAWYILDEEI